MSQIAFFNSATPTTITLTTVNTYYLINPATTLTGNNSFFSSNVFDMPSNGRLRYLNAEPQYLHIACSICLSTGTSADSFSIQFYKNGVGMTACTYILDFASNNVRNTFASHCVTNVNQNDYIEVYIADISSSGKSVAITTYNLQAVSCCPLIAPNA